MSSSNLILLGLGLGVFGCLTAFCWLLPTLTWEWLVTDDPYVDDGGEQLLPFPIRVDKDVPPGYVELHDEDGIVKRIGPFSPHPNVDSRPE